MPLAHSRKARRTTASATTSRIAIDDFGLRTSYVFTLFTSLCFRRQRLRSQSHCPDNRETLPIHGFLLPAIGCRVQTSNTPSFSVLRFNESTLTTLSRTTDAPDKGTTLLNNHSRFAHQCQRITQNPTVPEVYVKKKGSAAISDLAAKSRRHIRCDP